MSFDAGDANLYRYVGNHGTLASDPSGLAEKRVINGVEFTGSGHHKMTYATTRDELAFLNKDLVQEIESFRVQQPIIDGKDSGHIYRWHGDASGYDRWIVDLVRAEKAKFAEVNGGIEDWTKLTATQQRELLDSIKSSVDNAPPDSLGAMFNKAVEVGGDAEVAKQQAIYKQRLAHRMSSNANRRGILDLKPMLSGVKGTSLSKGKSATALVTIDLAITEYQVFASPYSVFEQDGTQNKIYDVYGTPDQSPLLPIRVATLNLLHKGLNTRFFDALQSDFESDQDRVIVDYLANNPKDSLYSQGTESGLSWETESRKARSYMDAQLHYRSLQGRMDPSQQRRYDLGDMDTIENLYWEIVIPSEYQ